MKRIYSSHDRLAVHHAKNLLEAEGIRAVVKNEILSSAMGELPPAECQAELWVRAAEAERAERILRFESQVDGTAWRCASCGEACEPQFTQCWRCGSTRSK
ncbi:MAG: putative signal transducing protein [Betaproteobacteria bacterium]